MTTAPVPGSPEWLKIITSSKIAAILGVSPYQSPFGLWHQMKGNVPAEEQTDVMARGHYLESGIMRWWRDQHPEYADWMNIQHFSTRDDLPFPNGATLDGLAAHVDDPKDQVIVEIKTSIQSDEWGETGTDAIPMYVLTQVYWQLAMTPAASRAYIALLGPFLNFSEFVVERDEVIQANLIAKAQAFYESLSLDIAPDLDNSLATFQTLKALHPDIDSGTVAQIDQGTADLYHAALNFEKHWAEQARAMKSKVLQVAGRANYVCVGETRIARRQPNKSGVSLVAIQPKGEM